MSTDQISVKPAPLDQLVRKAEKAFRSYHKRPPELVVAAPGRVNLIGEHIDYNDGFVMPMAIERYAVMAAGRTPDAASPQATFRSLNMDQTARIPLGAHSHPQLEGWGRYIEGVVAGFAARGAEVPPLEVVFNSDVPLGGGLSSSAALEVATATLLEAASGETLKPAEKALLCQHAEHHFAGVPCGIMDQFSSVFGKEDAVMLIDCRSQEVLPLPFATDDITVLITNSNVKHELTGGEYGQRRAQCDAALSKLQRSSWRNVKYQDLETHHTGLTDDEFRRARHVVSETYRTLQAAEAIQRNDWQSLGQLMYASHASLRDDYEVSCPELDHLVEIAQQIGPSGGVLGSRMTGAGFGGCTVSLVATASVDAVIERFHAGYEAKTGRSPSCFASRPARGAHVVRTDRRLSRSQSSDARICGGAKGHAN